MKVRPYEEHDEKELIQLWIDCGLVVPQNNPIRDIQRKLKVNPEWFLIGLENEKIVASCMVGYEGHRGWINYLAVSPDEQGKGFAKQIMTEAELLLREAGCPKINLLIRATNAEVVAVYESLGFIKDEVLSMGKRLEIDEPYPVGQNDMTSSTEYPIAREHQLKTERCVLRHVSETDFPYVFSATRTTGFNEGMTWEPPNEPDDLMKPYQKNCEAWKNGTEYVFTVESHDGTFLGRVGLHGTKTPGLWSIGFWTHPEHQGRGYMTEVAKRVIDFGFGDLSATEIEACHASWNKASRRVLEKCGMIWREHLPEGFLKRGEWVSEERLSIIRKA